MNSLGINIGSSSIKLVAFKDGKMDWASSVPHEGDFFGVVKKELSKKEISKDTLTLVTGTEGRFLFDVNKVIEPLCLEKAVEDLNLDIDAVVSMGGEDLIVYTIDKNNKIVNNFSGNKCASGTGEFFKQQLGRMDMKLDDVEGIPDDTKAHPLSTRCSVFMKSDCTHRLNKKEATKEEIVVSLSSVMATKVVDFLKRAKVLKGKVLLAGGMTKNKHIIRFIKEECPDIEFIAPPQAAYLEAYGAALIAKSSGSKFPGLDKLFKQSHVKFERYEALETAKGKVTYFDEKMGKVNSEREYILGIDGGSTTTKACLVDLETKEIVAQHYGRTHGDPVKALKECFVELKKKIKTDTGSEKVKIKLAATTGSSREILGVYVETPGVYNEIIAHAYGTTFFSDDVDTIFEIGGQDAKYVLLKNKVPIDYAMNEACSAGTGSFLEESASGDLNIENAWEIGDIALKAKNPLKFGEHCSAFINSDIRKAIQQGATQEDITAGIVTSIVSNYLNRVVGNRTIGNKIFLQGGVAKNKAIPLAFAMLLNKPIIVPPSPELMGCFGVAVLAAQKLEEDLLDKQDFDLDTIINSEIVYESVFECKACENLCPIQVLNVNNHKYMFGGRCNKYANSRKKKKNEGDVLDYVDQRNKLLFETFAAPKEKFEQKRDYTVGIPRCFSVNSLFPLYTWFFHELGIKTVVSDTIEHEGIARVESSYCFPAEIAHGAVQSIINKGCDYILVPHFRDMPSYEEDVHANFCPITQGLPYYIKKAFPEIVENQLLELIITFKFGETKALEFFLELGKRLKIEAVEIKAAFRKAVDMQQEYYMVARKLGEEALATAKGLDHPVIAILGRPYNAFVPEANMGIPRKFTSRGYSIIPFDILPFEDEEIFPNMYWYYGQQDMKTSVLLKDEPNIFVTFITNFSCAPDSFMLHYLKWQMGQKPFLVLELDSHTADAGVDTRVEAFLDIIDGYRSKLEVIKEVRYDNGLRINTEQTDNLMIDNIHTGEKIQVRNNKKVKILLSNMGTMVTEMMAPVVRSYGIGAVDLPKPTVKTLQMARAYMSGKECVPSQLVLGGALNFLASDQYRKDEIYVLFVPITTGPCRTGQYFVFYENLFKDLQIENVVVFTMNADNSYNEIGPDFGAYMWQELIMTDYLKDVQTSLRTCAENPEKALKQFDEHWKELLVVAGGPNFKKLYPALNAMAKDLATIPLKKSVIDSPRVLVVGEIYVRRDDFAVDELIDLMANKGIIGKVAGISEWIHYLDFVREYDLKKRIKLRSWIARPFCKERRILNKLKIEMMWKHHIEKKVKKALAPSKLVPETPHDMKRIMANTEEHFLNLELNSEIAVSSGSAATAMEDGFSGIVNISPFACLIGRVIEGIFTPWARERQYPVISVEIDGNVLPPNIINKMNIFMVNVLRFKKNPEIDAMIEANENDEADRA